MRWKQCKVESCVKRTRTAKYEVLSTVEESKATENAQVLERALPSCSKPGAYLGCLFFYVGYLGHFSGKSPI